MESASKCAWQMSAEKERKKIHINPTVVSHMSTRLLCIHAMLNSILVSEHTFQQLSEGQVRFMFPEYVIVSLCANHLHVLSQTRACWVIVKDEVVTHQQKSHLPLNSSVPFKSLYKAHTYYFKMLCFCFYQYCR